MNKLNFILAIILLLVIPSIGYSQETNTTNDSYFSNALFITLLTIIILLAIIIAAFSSVIKNVAESDFFTKLYQEKNDESNNNNSGIKAIVSIGLLLLSYSAFSQEKIHAVVKNDWLIGGLDQFTFYFLLTIILIESIILGVLFYQFNFLVETNTKKETTIRESKIIKTLTDAVDLERESAILLDHEYDGIRELDNNLPPWWKYGFYLTIIIAFTYLIHYHVIGSGDLQAKEYEKEMVKAKLDVAEYMKNSANNVDETTVKILTEATDLSTGKELFMANCSTCHGKLGEGTVGPNFTDEYWLHGGSIQDIFKSIKYGWVEKGMKAWKEDLSPMQMAQLTSYIKTLKGTNPPNQKAAQGDLYTEVGEVPVNDSTTVRKDSLTIQLKTDSLSTTKK